MTPAVVVQEFWHLMATNEFASVASVLAPEFAVEWPQSNERIRGPERFATMNAEYPAHGPWQFVINGTIAANSEVVTDVSVTDGVQHARAISFFTVIGSRINRLVEYWPEPFPARADRAHLTEPLA